MIDWSAVEAADHAVPAGHDPDRLVAALSRALADPDPEVRDGAPYRVLAAWIRRGAVPADRRLALGDEMAERFAHPEVQARTFAPLVLDMLVTRGDFRPAWVDAFERWYPAEADLRGHDARLGWLHAVAHGADLLGTFGLRREVPPARMLALAAARLTAPTAHVYEQREDDRLASAAARVLTRPDLTEDDATAWLEPLAADLRTLGRGPLPARASNLLRTLHALYLLADRGLRPAPGAAPVPLAHREAVKERVGAVLDLL
ncbi:hypothetical protein SUDANB120_03947 [Streptomyces sp. enrichment culture]|uniref:DUF2785 domain-containing protein n=1 Tax=Streptomyces sp. enrichment culture TaxID=1795815 RepID=UPI003F56D5A8